MFIILQDLKQPAHYSKGVSNSTKDILLVADADEEKQTNVFAFFFFFFKYTNEMVKSARGFETSATVSSFRQVVK